MAKQGSDSKKTNSTKDFAITALFGIAALALCLIAWRQGFAILSNISKGDLAAEHYFIDRTCLADTYWPGWPLNPNNNGTALGNFAPNLALYAVFYNSCKLSLITKANSLQTFLATGITMTLFLGYTACRITGLSKFTSLFSAISVTTAPCAFSRFAHLSLSQAWPVLPTIACCLIIINRNKIESGSDRWIALLKGYGLGCLLGTLSFPGQDYYIIFGSALIASCLAWKCSGPKRGANEIQSEECKMTWDGPASMAISAGFISISFFILTSKVWLWSIPAWAAAATNRSASEQFLYGFWPLALAQSPIYNSYLSKRLGEAGLALNESPFGSSGSILIMIASAIAISTLRSDALRAKMISRDTSREVNMPVAASIVFLISLAIALLCTTAGSFGTLFAVFVSPQLRALNRYMPYLYTPAVIVVALWLETTISRIKKEFSIGKYL